jgi:hypothetical protein
LAVCLGAGAEAAPLPGEIVLADYNGTLWPADVTSVAGSNVTVRWHDGTGSAARDMSLLRPYDWRNGSQVVCKWAKDGKYYKGSISALAGKSFTVVWTDGTKSPVQTKDCRDARPTASVPGFPTPAPTGSGKPAVVSKLPDGSLQCVPAVAYHNNKQFTGDWADEPVHPGYMSFAKTGCEITAWSTMLDYYGYSYNPAELRDKLNSMNGWESKKTHPSMSAMAKLAGGNFVKVNGQAKDNKSDPAILEAIRQHFCVERRGEPMLLNVDYEKEKNMDDTRGNHFIVNVGVVVSPGGVIDPLVLDPGSSDVGDDRPTIAPNKATTTFVRLSQIDRKKQGQYNARQLEWFRK